MVGWDRMDWGTKEFLKTKFDTSLPRGYSKEDLEEGRKDMWGTLLYKTQHGLL